jgi:toxin ParE1/3/4
VRIVYHSGALRDIDSIFAYISKDDAAAAERVVRRIRSVAALLANSPHIGRPGRRGARFLSVAGLPYVIIYRVGDDAVRIMAIFHTARDRHF